MKRVSRFGSLLLALLLALTGMGLTERVHLGTWGGKTEAVAFLPISPVQGAALLLGALMATAFFGMDVLLAVSPFLLIPEGILIGISFFKKAPS